MVDLTDRHTNGACRTPLADRYDVVLIDDAEAPLDAWWKHLGIANLTGHPAISVPVGHTPTGLPVGIQAIGRWDREGDLLAFAGDMASVQPWGDALPPISV